MKSFRKWTAVTLLASSGFVCTLLTATAQEASVRRLGRNLPEIGRGEPGDKAAPCESLWGAEPVLVFDCSGSTLLGPVHEGLILYGNGLAIRTRRDATEIPGNGTVELKSVSAAATKALWEELTAAGAASLCDDPVYVSDLPLTKVTVFAPAGTDAVAHTFAYYLPPAGAARFVELVIRNFIETEFEGI